MDARFRIPGTSIRFGFDALIGLIPGLGDLISLAISGYIVSAAGKMGASRNVMARMMLNSAVDAIIGAIPFLGDLFDVGFRANQRNVRLLQRHFNENRYRGGAAKVMVPAVIAVLLLFGLLIWGMVELVRWVF